jgi:hypothetical protein
MKKLIYILSLFVIFSHFIFCQSGVWKIEHKNSILSVDINGSHNDRLVSRTTGVAPLAVHFFSTFVSGDEKSDRFHHYDYTWNFGDTGSGNWGTTGKSKNITKGAVAVHIYENPGVYNITLTIRNHSVVVGTENYSVTVIDPDSFYSGTKTTCVNVSGDSNFTGAPTGSRHISTNDIPTITQYATAGSRVLFKRGSSWTVSSNLNWPNNTGPVTIGAYGTGTGLDFQTGIYNNNPHITITGNFFSQDSKQDWRVMDLHLINAARTFHAIGGAESMQRQLFLRLKIEGFASGIVTTHWNNSKCMQNDKLVYASCNISDADSNDIYCGSERLAMLGNVLKDTRQSQVVRVWLAYHSVIQHNIISGSCLDMTTNAREALKIHSTKTYELGTPVNGTSILRNETEYLIVSDNIIGSSGPFPFQIAPGTSASTEERLSNLIIERNRVITDYGLTGGDLAQTGLNIWSIRYCTVRNNIFDGTESKDNYNGIVVLKLGVSPTPAYTEIYNNTIYRGDSSSGVHRGIHIQSTATLTTVRNNLISFPYATGTVYGLVDEATDTVSYNNLLTNTAGFVDPNNATPLSRNFKLQAGSPAENQGTNVPVYDDYYMNPRPESLSDLGACEQ